MKYAKKVNIWNLDFAQRDKLQVGQWVTAGDEGPTGRWAGQRSNDIGSVSWSRTKPDFAIKRIYAQG